jgi:hypothetical protein
MSKPRCAASGDPSKKGGPDAFRGEKGEIRQKVNQTVLLVLIALVSVSAATFAWFSIATNTKVRSMDLSITTGASLRFDTTAHTTFNEYVKTLNFTQIADQIRAAFGYDPAAADSGLEPVTSADGSAFADENGVAVAADKGQYLEFTLHFMATKDMTVHLTSDNSKDAEDGTLVKTDNGAAQAMRISFTAGEKTAIYQPVGTSANTFTLATAGEMRYDDSNALFSLKADTDQPVTVHVWMEGSDAACTDELRGSQYTIRLRFEGTGPNGEVLE